MDTPLSPGAELKCGIYGMMLAELHDKESASLRLDASAFRVFAKSAERLERALMSWFSRKVTLTLIDDTLGAVFASSKMSPDDLPDSFKSNTALHLGDNDWTVVHAEPATKAEFTKSGKLTLRLRKVQIEAPKAISFSQLDVTERFDDNESLSADEWIATTPLNSMVDASEASGLPLRDADSEEVYRVASTLSQLREAIRIEGDGVYCPICHIANIDLGKLRTPCPTCGRALLKFGWT
jgi:hypothetical protein